MIVPSFTSSFRKYAQAGSRAILFLIILFTLDISIAALLGNLYSGIYVGPGRYNYIKRNRFDCLVMGSSTSRSLYDEIISQSLGISVLNVGLDGAALIYSRCLLELVLRYNVAPKLILLNLDLFELRKTAWSGNFYSMIEYFAPLYGESEYIDKALQKGRLLEPLKYKLVSYKYNDLVLAIILKKLQGEKEYRRELAPAGALQLPIDEKILREKFPDDEEIDQRKLALLDEFITVCKRNNIALVVVTSPVFNPFHRKTNSDRAIENTLEKVTKDRGIPFIGVTQEKYSVFQDPTMFSDVLHLNDKGSRLFSGLLCRELRSLFNPKSWIGRNYERGLSSSQATSNLAHNLRAKISRRAISSCPLERLNVPRLQKNFIME